MDSKPEPVRVRILGASDLRRVAVASETDPRTVERALEGRPIRPASLARIKRALKACGLGTQLLPEDEIELQHRELRVRAAEARVVHRVRTALVEAAPSRLAAKIAEAPTSASKE